MYSIQYEWKRDEEGNSWKLDLPSFESWLRENAGEKYVGNSADSVLTLWFSEEPSEDVKELVHLMWENTLPEDEAPKIKLANDRELAVAKAKIEIVNQNWNQLISAERKIVLNQALSDSDKDALLVKYPQA